MDPDEYQRRSPERAHARRSDPETSHAAAASISEERLRDSQRVVLALFDARRRLHDEALLRAQPSADSVPKQSPSGYRTRRRELVDLGYLRDSGDRTVLPSGRQSIIWERTSKEARG